VGEHGAVVMGFANTSDSSQCNKMRREKKKKWIEYMTTVT
jgi:hypothetical protein